MVETLAALSAFLKVGADLGTRFRKYSAV